ncbi:MAG TPA: tetratricopeptide repeat protein [Kofleriaceae bacterium]
MRKLHSIVLIAGLALAPATALAQRAMRDLPSTERGPTAELYIRKRPPSPEAPVLDEELKKLLNTKEKARDDKRLEAIGLLRSFLESKPAGETRAEGMFKLAELLWEESRRQFLIRMDDFSREVEKCSNAKSDCPQPKEPRIDLKEAAALYLQLHDEFPSFRRMDLVTYLIGFAAKEDGKEDVAMGRFQEVIDKYPNSALYGDSWMMIGEHYFAAGEWGKARDAYKNVGDTAATSDLALFKIAWCEWKLGDSMQAAKDFKKVLDKAVEQEKNGTAAQRQRGQNLKEEALEYLVVVFTEDRTISPKEVFDFLVSIDGEQYSRDVMVKVAESYAAQAEWERSTDAYHFLIRMDPEALKSADYQRSIIENWNSALDIDRSQEEIKVLLTNFGPDTAWAKAQRNREALQKSLGITEELVRSTAKQMHAEAQRREKSDKKPDINLYTRVANAYEQYLAAFGTGKNPSSHAIEIRFYRAEILYYRLGKLEEAGDEYLAVGKTSPVGEFHKDALFNAMEAFEKARPKDTQGRSKLYPVDKKFGEAIDLYATLFPADKRLVGVIFKNGQMFYDYGEYGEAIKRFGLIVTKYPDDENAGPAGDRILGALNKAEDYETIEEWARKLKKAKAFAAPDQQARLDRLIVESIQKSGDKYAEAGKYEQAAGFYLRIPKETKDPKVAAQAQMNAGVMYEKSKEPEKAADIYLDIANTYGDKNPEIAEKAAFTAGQVYEKVVFYDKAASAYELVWTKFRTGSRSADALFNAGLLRQALGQNKEAIAHYTEYTKKFRERKDAPDVAFNIGVVLESSGDEGAAHKAYEDYARTYRSTNKRIVEAYTRAGRMSYKAGKYKDAKEELAQAQKIWKSLAGDAKKTSTTWAAEARYYEAELVFRDFEKVTLDVSPKQLTKALAAKSKLLADAKKIYLSVVDYSDLKWATAALYRIGQVYDGFAESLVNASVPKGLNEEQAQAYHDALDTYVVEIQDQAVESFATAYQKAIQMQVYDEYTAKIREALGRLAADKYPPERESREKARVGDRPPAPPFVTEVVR